jgi:hypothetical protein
MLVKELTTKISNFDFEGAQEILLKVKEKLS